MHGAEWRVISRIVCDARVVLSPLERYACYVSLFMVKYVK